MCGDEPCRRRWSKRGSSPGSLQKSSSADTDRSMAEDAETRRTRRAGETPGGQRTPRALPTETCRKGHSGSNRQGREKRRRRIPGSAGSRPPHGPPNEFARSRGGGRTGSLRRHGTERGTGGTVSVEGETNLMRGRCVDRRGTRRRSPIPSGSGRRSRRIRREIHPIRKLNAEREVEVHERMTTLRS